jgi:hypothetical protein
MGRGGSGKKRARRARAPEPPIALDSIDLLAGLAPGVELCADDLPPGIATASESQLPEPASMTVAEAGRLIRTGDGTVRRLIRTTVLTPPDRPRPRVAADTDRAGVPPRTPDKPGE